MKRILAAFVVLFLAAALAFFVFKDDVAAAIVQRAADVAQERAGRRGVTLSGLEFGSVTMNGLFEIECLNVRVRASVPRSALSDDGESVSFVVRRARARVDSVWSGRVVVIVEGATVHVLQPDGTLSGRWITDLDGEAIVQVSWREPAESLRQLEGELHRLVLEGSMDVPARLRGQARFMVNGRWFEATVLSSTDGRSTRIMLDRGDVKQVSEGYTRALTESEIDLVAQYPTLAPELLRLAERAWDAALDMRRKDRGYPYDAFRHVYWSYLLTRRYGAEFSKRVTDAHEINPTYERAVRDLEMDLANNAIGRDYALMGVAEEEIAAKVLTDPRVRARVR